MCRSVLNAFAAIALFAGAATTATAQNLVVSNARIMVDKRGQPDAGKPNVKFGFSIPRIAGAPFTRSR